MWIIRVKDSMIDDLIQRMFNQKRVVISALLFSVIASHLFCDNAAAGFSSERAPFSIQFRDQISPYKITGVFVLPDELLTLEVQETTKREGYVLKSSAGKAVLKEKGKWEWQAPHDSGLYPLQIVHTPSNDSVNLNIFVMVPLGHLKGEYLNGYRIGRYPRKPLKQLPIYKPPRGFIEVTKENEEALVSPHFRLRQFISKQADGYPKYVVLRERLLLKLELILEKTNGGGYPCDTFHIMSGYRTPYYNKAIGNVEYSRHLYGGAADIFIDENPEDGMMDDLNRDGKIDYRDAAVLYDIIDSLYGKPFYERFLGGLGWYRKTTSHGPFVHVDVRGFRARWGD